MNGSVTGGEWASGAGATKFVAPRRWGECVDGCVVFLLARSTMRTCYETVVAHNRLITVQKCVSPIDVGILVWWAQYDCFLQTWHNHTVWPWPYSVSYTSSLCALQCLYNSFYSLHWIILTLLYYSTTIPTRPVSLFTRVLCTRFLRHENKNSLVQ